MPETNDVTFDERTPYTRVEASQESSRANDIAERLVVSGLAKDVTSARKVVFIVVAACSVLVLGLLLVLQFRGPATPKEPLEPQGLRVEDIR